MRFPLGGGINGLAAQEGEPVSTFDYLVDPRIPHNPDDTEVADRLALRGMAAAPLRAPGGEVIGTLAVSSTEPRAFQPDELDLLQGLADQAAIAITNTNLLTRLAELGGALPLPRRERPGPGLVDRRRGPLHLPVGRRRAADRPARRRVPRQALRGAGPRLVARGRRVRLRGRHDHGIAGDPRPGQRRGSGRRAGPGRVHRHGPARRGRHGSPGPTARSATCANATGSSASCASRRRASASSCRRRRTSSTARDAEGRFLFIAEGVEALFGWTADEVVGHDLRRPHGRGVAAGGARELRAAARGARRRPPLPVHAPPSRRRRSLPARDLVGLRLGGRQSSPGCRGRSAASASRSGWSASCRLRGALPVPGRELARRGLRDRPGRHVHVPLRGHRAADRVHSPREVTTSTSRRVVDPIDDRASRRTAGRSSSPTRAASRSRSCRSSARTAAHDARRGPRDRHQPPTTGRSRASTAPRATSPSASDSSASCARPRSATAISCRRRRTSSG